MKTSLYLYENFILCCIYFVTTTAGIWNTSKTRDHSQTKQLEGMTTTIWQPPALHRHMEKKSLSSKIHWDAEGFPICEISYSPFPKEEKKRSSNPENKLNKRHRYLNRDRHANPLLEHLSAGLLGIGCSWGKTKKTQICTRKQTNHKFHKRTQLILPCA